MADLMSSVRAVSRDDLLRSEHEDFGSDSVRSTRTEDAEVAAAAQAALDECMRSMLGTRVDAYVSQPSPKKSPNSSATPKLTNGDAEMKDGDSSSDDDELQSPTSRPAPPKVTEHVFRMFTTSRRTTSVTVGSASDGDSSAPVVLLEEIFFDNRGIRLDGSGGSIGPGAIVGPARPLSHYIVGNISEDARAQYAHSAVTGEAILAQASPSRRNAWGFEVPWRARAVQRVSKADLRKLIANALAPDQPEPKNLPAAIRAAVNLLPTWAANGDASAPQKCTVASQKKVRPNKKARILHRKRAQEKREREAAEALKAQCKEEQLSEKKKRLNRIKKLRRREKAKAEKADGAGSVDGGAGNDD